jgi:hypothetical protein
MPDGRTIEGFPPVCRVTFVAQKKWLWYYSWDYKK